MILFTWNSGCIPVPSSWLRLGLPQTENVVILQNTARLSSYSELLTVLLKTTRKNEQAWQMLFQLGNF